MISKGFTLIEVMIIICILGILSAIAIPAIMGDSKPNPNISRGFNGIIEVRCISGVQFVIGYNGSSTQIVDPYGKGIPCNQ